MNKHQARRAAMARKGHKHSAPVNKLAAVAAYEASPKQRWFDRVSLTPSPLAKAFDKSPTRGAYAPIFGQGQGPKRERVTPADKRAFQGWNGVIDPVNQKRDDRPERDYRIADHPKKPGKVRKSFRKFNATGKA